MHKDIDPNIYHAGLISKERETALCIAARNASKEIVEMLLMSPKFDPNYESRFFQSFKFVSLFRWFLCLILRALQIAANSENNEIVDVLNEFMKTQMKINK